jgi:hypothetical protein
VGEPKPETPRQGRSWLMASGEGKRLVAIAKKVLAMRGKLKVS